MFSSTGLTQLSVNLNKIALLRNARGHDFPNVLDFSRRAILAGAGGITLHPRPDQRHARYEDVLTTAKMLRQFPGKEINVEGYPSQTLIDLAIEAKVHQCTLVPDAPGQITSDHGWDIKNNLSFLQSKVAKLHAHGIRVSLFVDPDEKQCALAAQTQTDRVELYTEDWAKAAQGKTATMCLQKYKLAAKAARDQGLEVNAGHDLNLQNLAQFLQQIAPVAEVSIGHALIVEALTFGFDAVVRQYQKICASSSFAELG